MIRPATHADFPAILDLNEESVQFLSPLDEPGLAHLHRGAAYHKVAEVDGAVGAFLLVAFVLSPELAALVRPDADAGAS